MLGSALLLAGQVPAGTPAVARSHAQQTPHLGAHAIEDRVKLLTVELQLTPVQQTEVRRILQNQRDSVSRIWADSNAPSSYRVAAMRELNQRTAQQIRAVLDEQQRKHYSVTAPSATPDAGQRTVEQWMSATKTH